MKRMLIISAIAAAHFFATLFYLFTQATGGAVGAASSAWAGALSGGSAGPTLAERLSIIAGMLPLLPCGLFFLAFPDSITWLGKAFYPVVFLNSILWGIALYSLASYVCRSVRHAR